MYDVIHQVIYKMTQSFKQKCDYWWRGSVRPPLGLARLPKKLGYRRVKLHYITCILYF